MLFGKDKSKIKDNSYRVYKLQHGINMEHGKSKEFLEQDEEQLSLQEERIELLEKVLKKINDYFVELTADVIAPFKFMFFVKEISYYFRIEIFEKGLNEKDVAIFVEKNRPGVSVRSSYGLIPGIKRFEPGDNISSLNIKAKRNKEQELILNEEIALDIVNHFDEIKILAKNSLQRAIEEKNKIEEALIESRKKKMESFKSFLEN